MSPFCRYCVLIIFSSVISMLFLSCKENSTAIPNQFQIGGNNNLTVTGIQYDEFQRIVPFEGSALLTLVDGEYSYHRSISANNTSYLFKNISNSQVIIRGEKNGFYPYESSYYTSVVRFYPFPSPEMRFDSIQILPGNFYSEVAIRLVSHQKIPNDAVLYYSCFFGLDSMVSSKPGTYFGYYTSASFGSDRFEAAFDKFLYRFPAGTKIFVTARFETGATKYFYDETAKVYVLTNLEENTNIITSFVY